MKVCYKERTEANSFTRHLVESNLGESLQTGLPDQIHRDRCRHQDYFESAQRLYRRKVAQGLETQGSPGPQPPVFNMRELVRPLANN